ncbi:MAG: hypothetical protein H0T11_05120 [Chthoniobacterales bacterium]|nr:hypothetical protein [Chthoniobacterales bacterium]
MDEALARVLERAKTDSRWLITAAYLYQGQGQLDQAVASIEKVMADFAKFDGGTQRNLLRSAGTLYLSRNAPEDPQRAYDAYLKLLDLEPNDLAVLNNMACLLADSMKPPRVAEARKYSQRAYDLMVSAGRNEPLLLDTHGWVLTLNDRVDEGIDLLRQAIAAKPFTEGHYHLAEAYLKRAYPQEAEKQLELALEEVRKTEEAKGLVPEDLKRKIEDAKLRAQQGIEKQQAKAAS